MERVTYENGDPLTLQLKFACKMKNLELSNLILLLGETNVSVSLHFQELKVLSACRLWGQCE